MTAWPLWQAVPEVPADYGYLVALLVAAVAALVGALVWMERRWVKREEQARDDYKSDCAQRLVDQKAAYEAHAALLREGYEARLRMQDALVAQMRTELNETAPVLRELATTVALMGERIGHGPARRPAGRRGP